jgi:signal transduction histidine kinase
MADQLRHAYSYGDAVRALLRSIWNEPRPFDAPSRVQRDWLLVGIVVLAVALEGLFRPDLPFRWLQVAVVAALAPLLLWRRTSPLLVLVVVFVSANVLTALTGDPDGMYSSVFALFVVYAVIRWGSGREAVAGLAIVLATAVFSMLMSSSPPADVVGGFVVLLSSVALGAAFRERARARSREIEQIRLLERERLARDLHDTVAHHVSAIAIRAQAGLATSSARPGAVEDALRLIEAEASSTLVEMRSMVRMLRRDDPAELSPSPRIADLSDLAGRNGDGPDVDVEILGDVDAVSPSVAAALFRIAQESITNARRHARHATRIDVRVVADDGRIHLRVSDNGDGGAARPPDSGFGLRGMSERAHLLGGTFDAGPDPDRGWTVAAVLPRRGPA